MPSQDTDEAIMGSRLYDAQDQIQELEEKIGDLNGRRKDALNYLRQSLKSGNAAMAYTLIDSAINTLEKAEDGHE